MRNIVYFFAAAIGFVASSCLPGCAAGYWGGDAAGRNPGLSVERNIFGMRAELSSDAGVELESMIVNRESGEFNLHGLKFQQDASAVTSAQAAKLLSIAELQLTQVEYARVTWQGVVQTVDVALRHIAPMLNILAAAQIDTTSTGFNLKLPNGFEVGGQRATDAAALRAILEGLAQQTAAARSTLLTGASSSVLPAPEAEPELPMLPPASAPATQPDTP